MSHPPQAAPASARQPDVGGDGSLTRELLDSLDRAILVIAALAGKPQFHRIALRAAGLGEGRQLDHPAHLVDPALYAVLAELDAAPRQAATSIASHLGLHPATVSHHLATLRERRLLGPASVHLGDQRRRVTKLTDAGREAYSALHLARLALLASLIADWSADDRRDLALLLHHFAGATVRLHLREHDCRMQARSDRRSRHLERERTAERRRSRSRSRRATPDEREE
jgi:DNA-binding MarR family transcriptional regulator